MQLARPIANGQPASSPVGSHQSVIRRWPALVLFTSSVGLLAVARWLQPSPQGMGTHTQLGLPGCGFLHTTGIPCATCGMTTSFSLAARGHMIQSFRNQPAGMILAVCVAVTAMVSGWALVAMASLGPLGRWIWRPLNVALLAAVLLGSWLYKILIVRGVL